MGGRTLTAGDANLAVVYTLSKLNILVTSLVLTFIAFPPVFYFSVFRPCWNCQVRCARIDQGCSAFSRPRQQYVARLQATHS